MLVELMPLVIDTKMVLSFIPICSLNKTSSRIPEINKTVPVMIEITRYLVVLISFLIVWDNIKNKPKRPKNIISFPLDDPIKKVYVIGRITGFNMSVRKIIPPRRINMAPTSIVLLTFINNNLIINTLNK